MKPPNEVEECLKRELAQVSKEYEELLTHTAMWAKLMAQAGETETDGGAK